MIQYLNNISKIIQIEDKYISSFIVEQDENIDSITVASFGEEWSKFAAFTAQEIKEVGDQYFDILPKSLNLKEANVLDMGCGSGRWTKYLSDKVKFIEAVDPSKAVLSAYYLLKNESNVRITQASVEHLPFPDNSFDLVFSLGVLHHIPDTKRAMQKCVNQVKSDGYFLVYLYYNLDNRGPFYKTIFHASTLIRRVVSKLPSGLKKLKCDALAVTIYWPFVNFSRLLRKVGLENTAKKIPLSYYMDKTWNIIRNDALDRFGTPLEQRFSKMEIEKMMKDCGLTEIVFSKGEPYWHAIGRKI
jgi:ubiquinone/menaquinone biosynthesis C-methylase UbiE